MTDIELLRQLTRRMAELRKRLEDALQQAEGNQHDPAVQRIASEFDQVLIEYMRDKSNR